MLVKPVHSQKANFPNSFTVLGISILASPEHPQKALSGIFVMPDGIWMEVNPEQC